MKIFTNTSTNYLSYSHPCPFSPNPRPLPRARLHWRSITNLRLSASICGSFLRKVLDEIKVVEEGLKAAGVKEDSQES